jgi:galactonate dehydratase
MIESTLVSAELHLVRVTSKTCWTFLRLHTADGLTGEGEATFFGREQEQLTAAERLVPLALLEASIRYPGEFAERHEPEDRVQSSIVSALDQALWSLHAQRDEHSLAGTLGLRRERIPVYANINRRTTSRSPVDFAASAQAALAEGHVAFKLAPFDEVDTKVCTQGDGVKAMLAGLARVAAVREVVGDRARLMVDCHWRFDEATAAVLNEAAAKLDVYWIETPLPEVEANIPALVRLRGQCNALGMRQAGLETSVGWDEMRPYCEAGAYDVVMPDLKYIGGLCELQKTVDGCIEHNVQVSPHNPSGPVCHAFSLQVSATIDAFDMLELQFDESPLFEQLVGSPVMPVRRGYAELPVGRGLGVSLVPGLLKQHAERSAREWSA